MPSELWNQGRVVGLSAYEVYVNQTLSEDPNAEPASERQWLASSLAMGSSLLLKINPNQITQIADTVTGKPYYIFTVSLPATSTLCAANTIIANLFVGEGGYTNSEGNVASDNFATYIKEYGPLFSNTTNYTNIQSNSNITSNAAGFRNYKTQLRTDILNYSYIVDGLVIQSGKYVDAYNDDTTITGNSPKVIPDFDINDVPFIKIWFNKMPTASFEILLTGFTIRTVVNGETGLDNQIFTPYYTDGDFLGPGAFPWANKIVFSTPTSAINQYFIDKYERKIANEANFTQVEDTPVIDMKSTDPGDYYKINYTNARISDNVKDFNTMGDGSAVLTIYRKSEIYPPALFGTYVTKTGQNYLNPIDVVAPGTVKSFPNSTSQTLQDYQDTYPGTVAISKNDDGTISTLDSTGKLVPAASVSHINFKTSSSTTTGSGAIAVVSKAGNKKEVSISAGPGGSETPYVMDNPPNTVLATNSDDIYWAALLNALANNKKIDVLGSNLKNFKAGLTSTGSNTNLDRNFTANKLISKGDITTDSGNITTSSGILHTGKEYIEFNSKTANGSPATLRLYITGTPPSGNIPDGSIGIGWGFDN